MRDAVSYTKVKDVTLLCYTRDTDGWRPNVRYSTSVKNLLRRRTGDSNPNWRTQVKRQQNATTDMSGTYDTYKGIRGRFRVDYRNYFVTGDPTWNQVEGDLTCQQLAIDWNPSISVAVARNRALISYFNNARNMQQTFTGPLFLGELRESLKMIRNPAQGLKNLANQWIGKAGRARRKFKPGKKGNDQFKRELSSLWLEQAFGWQPLVSDINSAFKTFRRLRDTRTQAPISGYGVEKIDVPTRTFTEVPYDWFLIRYRANRRSFEQAVVKFRGAVALRTIGSKTDALEPFGFTFDSFLPTIWELLPWSFLIDYFSNIGDVISAGTFSRASLVWTCESQIVFQVTEMQGWPDLDYIKQVLGSNYISASGTNVSARAERRSIQRNANSLLGVPTLSFEIPGRSAQWANMTALFASANSIHPQRVRR